MSQNVNRGRGGRGRGRGRGSGPAQQTRAQLLAALAAMDNQQPVQQQAWTCCDKTFPLEVRYRQHRASVHGEPIVRADGTMATPRPTPEQERQRSRADLERRRAQGADNGYPQNAVAGPSQETTRWSLAPPLWVSSSTQKNVRIDSLLKSRAQLLNGRDLYVHQMDVFNLGNGKGNTANLTSVVSFRDNEVDGVTIQVPYPVFEFVGLDLGVHGEFGHHGDFALVYMTYPNGSNGLQQSNTVSQDKSSLRRNTMLAMRFSHNLSRHTIITGSGHFFVPADGSGSLIQSAVHTNVVSGTSVLNPDAVLVTVTTSLVFAVSGDRQ